MGRAWIRCALALTLALAAVAGNAVVAHAGTGPRWRSARLVDHRRPFDGADLYSASCASASLCVGLDDEGDALTTTDPAGAWIPTALWPRDQASGLSNVSCAGGPICVVANWNGDVWASADPAAGYRNWRRIHLFTGSLSTDPVVSCAAGPVCAVAAGASVYVSHDPTAGAASWTAVDVAPPGSTLRDVACVSSGACYAIDDHDLLRSADPAAGASAWSTATGIDDATLTHLACASSRLCAVTDSAGRVLTSTDPVAAPTWRGTALPGASALGAGLVSVACPRVTLCVIGALDGRVFVSHAAAAGAGWRATKLTGTDLLDGVSCSVSATCLLVASRVAEVTHAPAARRSAWHAIDPGFDGLRSIACPAAGRCVAGDDSDRIFSTGAGRARLPRWRHDGNPVDADTDGGALALTCPGLRLCVGVDDAGNVLVTRHPFRGDGGWRRAARGRPATTFRESGVACPSSRLCIAVDGGRVAVARRPGRAAAVWRSAIVDHGRYECNHDGRGCEPVTLTSIACSSASLCVAGDADGRLFVSRDPAGGAATWQVQRPFPSPFGIEVITGVACVPHAGCVATDSTGDLLQSRHPTAGRWTITRVERHGTLDAIECVSATLCVAADDRGQVLRTGDPWAATPTWAYRRIDGRSRLTSVSCSSSSDCGAVDGLGHATVTR